MSVRLLAGNEGELFRQIRLEALRREPEAFASSAAEWECLSRQEWQLRLEAGPVAVALRDGEPIGLMGLLPERRQRTRHRATLVMVYVRREERGRGLADRMLSKLIAAAPSLGVRQLELHVSGENGAAIGFYRRAGFAEVGRLPAAFVHDGRFIAELVMVRQLDGLSGSRG